MLSQFSAPTPTASNNLPLMAFAARVASQAGLHQALEDVRFDETTFRNAPRCTSKAPISVEREKLRPGAATSSSHSHVSRNVSKTTTHGSRLSTRGPNFAHFGSVTSDSKMGVKPPGKAGGVLVRLRNSLLHRFRGSRRSQRWHVSAQWAIIQPGCVWQAPAVAYDVQLSGYTSLQGHDDGDLGARSLAAAHAASVDSAKAASRSAPVCCAQSGLRFAGASCEALRRFC
mmetsp:Transcript_12098/g.41809  ORF Transcript_12098/g.41809 Transcript_12098/m.41809 type:complete len:229 (+) Transcript_12098:430-1116(+)